MTSTTAIENLIPLSATLAVANQAMRMNRIKTLRRKKRRKFL